MFIQNLGGMKMNKCERDLEKECKHMIQVLRLECCGLKRSQELEYQSKGSIDLEGNKKFYLCSRSYKMLEKTG